MAVDASAEAKSRREVDVHEGTALLVSGLDSTATTDTEKTTVGEDPIDDAATQEAEVTAVDVGGRA